MLFSALNSQDDAEVVGAMDLLDEEGRARLVPALILYHPSRAVVFRALNLLAKSGRVDFVPIADRLFDSPDAEIRAAALRARSTVRPEASLLRARRRGPQPARSRDGIVGLIAGGWGSDDARQIMDDLYEIAVRFLTCGDDGNVVARGARRIQHEKRKPAVAGDEAELHRRKRGPRHVHSRTSLLIRAQILRAVPPNRTAEDDAALRRADEVHQVADLRRRQRRIVLDLREGT